MQDRSALHTLVVNSLEERIVVLDHTGIIVEVNDSWTKFGEENGLSGESAHVGSNYLKVLADSAANGDGVANEAAQGIFDVINGNRAAFYIEYPCHSPDEKRWFVMRITRLTDDTSGLFVISHHNITQLKLARELAEHLAMHDSLTGLANRRYFSQFIKREVRRSIRNQSPISLIAVDIDYFKQYNDTMGHDAGDRCLSAVGQALLAYARRPGDLAARLGGDEFVLLLGETDFTGSQKVAEAILKLVHDLRLVFGELGQLSISAGVASMFPSELLGEDFLIQEADKALYQAKSTGRNRIVCVQPVANQQGLGTVQE